MEKDLKVLKEEYAKLAAEKINEDNIDFETLINDLKVLKEEYAKLVAEKIINEGMLDEEVEEEDEVSEEQVDKRDIIRQIMAIVGKTGNNEIVRTVAKLAEKLAYNGSEAKDGDVDESYEEDNTADIIAEDFSNVSESTEEVTETKKVKAFSRFDNLNESAEEPSTRKAFTRFPNLK